MTFDEIIDRLGGVRNGMARCPAHNDSTSSLSVTEGDEGRVLLHCHAGCRVDDVAAAIGITTKDLFQRRNGDDRERRRIVATYDYTDESGKLLYQSVRYDPKDFKQRRPDGRGGWLWKLGDVRIVPYRLPELLEAIIAGRPVFIAEGEKDVDALVAAGEAATCGPMGAGKWSKVDYPGAVVYGVEMRPVRALAGVEVIVVADKDKAGYDHARDVARSLIDHSDPYKRPTNVNVVEAKIGKDAADHLGAGCTVDEFEVIASTDPELVYGETVTLDAWLALSPPDSDAQPHTPPPGAPTEAPDMAYDLRILDRFKEAVVCMGLVGEVRTACLTYLIVTSRLLDKPVSSAIKGHTSSGKSFTVETTLKFFPSAAYLEFTAMSEKALVYSKDDYRHRTIVIYEIVALREGVEDDMTAYFVRSLLSEGRISYPVTVREKDGGFVTKTIVKEGPTNMIVTTTKTKIHVENETRVLSLNTDDSREQTNRILAALADEEGTGPDLQQWHAIQLWLQSVGERRVTIPYAGQLAELVPPVAVRLRRDFGAVLNLIRTHAILHQQTRGRDDAGRIVATIDDYEVVRDLVGDLISEAVGTTVTETVRETVLAVVGLSPAHADGVTARHLADHLNLDRSTVARRLAMAGGGGYLRNLEDRRGRPGRWQIGDPLPDEVTILPEPSALVAGDAQVHSSAR